MNLYVHSEKCGMSVFLEIGLDTGKGLIDNASLSGLENALKAYPNVNFVICFADTVTGEKLEGALNAAFALLDKYENICMQLYEASEDKVKKYSARLLFGTGKTVREKEYSTGKYLDDLYVSEALTEEEYRNICCGNAERIFASGR